MIGYKLLEREKIDVRCKYCALKVVKEVRRGKKSGHDKEITKLLPFLNSYYSSQLLFLISFHVSRPYCVVH